MTGKLWGAGIAALLAQGAAAATAQEPIVPRQVFSSDSITAGFTQVSPNGRWVVMAVDNSGEGSSLWLAPANGGAPFRLTSEGYRDRTPVWFASGDRIVFESTRPNRNGDRNFYTMVLSIDPATGRTIGGPRQVGSEPTFRGGQPSPDGRWVPYVTAETPRRLKVVPSNGGTARELVRLDANVVNIAGVFFGPDSKQLYYQEAAPGTPNAMRHTLKRVPVEGGMPEVVASADHPLRILAGDPRYVLHQVAPPGESPRWEIRRLDGSLVGTTAFPREMTSPTLTADGLGLMGVDSDWKSSVEVVSFDGGDPQVLVSGQRHWPEAWMPDGSAVITDRWTGTEFVVETLPLTDGPAKAVRIPNHDQGGWHSSIGPWYSYRIPLRGQGPNAGDALHAVNVLTGVSREVVSSTIRLPIRGRGGQEQDGARWIYATRPTAGGPIEVHSLDPSTGTTDLIRRFPLGTRINPNGIFVHGQRIAFMVVRGDSLDLMMLSGSPDPRRFATFSRNGFVANWSWDGTRIAVADWLPGTPRRWGVWLATLRADGTTAAAVRRYDLGVEDGCDSFTWTPDDSHLVMLCYGDSGRIMKLRVSDGELRVVVPSETPQEVWEYYLSPDGQRVVYPVQHDAGSSVHVFDLKPLLGRTR